VKREWAVLVAMHFPEPELREFPGHDKDVVITSSVVSPALLSRDVFQEHAPSRSPKVLRFVALVVVTSLAVALVVAGVCLLIAHQLGAASR
jgi:hypothetical protein